MFSVIIPTMYRVDGLNSTLFNLCQIDCINEILVIENASCPYDRYTNKKITYINKGYNLYCNPSWNLGVQSSSSKYICILNDDIFFDFELVFSEVAISNILEKCGILGLSENCFDNLKQSKELKFIETKVRGFGFGCCFFLKKENYLPIPDDLLIFWGDEWLFKNQFKPNYKISNITTNCVVGATSSEMQFKPISEKDTEIWKMKYNY